MNRAYIALFGILYFVSATLLITASLFSSKALPAWEGILDVILPAILLVIFWLLQKQIDFNIALTGFAWRLYVLFQILPRAIYLWNEESA